MRRAVVLLGAVLMGCGGDGTRPPDEPAAAALALRLRPQLAALEKYAAEDRFVLSEAVRADLTELMQLAFGPGRLRGRAGALVKRGLLENENVLWVLEASLADEDAMLRSHAAFELGRLGRQGSILPLLKRLKYERDMSVLVWVVAALAQLGNHAGLPLLARAMERADTAESARLRALEICRAAGRPTTDLPPDEELRAALGELECAWRETGRVRGAAAAEVADALATARIAALLLALQGQALRPVDDARFVLSRAGALGLPLLERALGAEEVYLRSHALEIVRALGPAARDVAPAVRPLLGDPLCAADAARTLGSLRATEALPQLLAMLKSPAAELRAAAAGALGPLGARAAVGPLQAILEDGDESMDVRVLAAFSLALFEQGRPAYRFLVERRDKGDYHAPTIAELLGRIDERGW